MSVRGEFDRILGDAIACLRGGDETAQALARDLQSARAAASDDLARAAERVLALWDARPPAKLVAPEARPTLDDVTDRMVAISKVVLGR